MTYRHFLIPLLVLVPLSAGAAAYPTTLGLSEASTPAGTNAYVASSDVTVLSPVPADLVVAGGSVSINAPVEGDILAAGFTVTASGGAGGDVRALGGRVYIQGAVTGDVAAAGGTVRIESHARNIYAAGGSLEVTGGSAGDVTLYGASVALSGDYGGNVSVVASNNFTIGEGTHIKGVLKYSAPEQLVAPASARIDGGVRYTGAYAYVPTNQQVHQYAILGSGVFFLVRAIAGGIVAGLIVGLFPALSNAVVSTILAHRRRPVRILELGLLGVALAVFTPLVCLLLFLSFVGAGVSLLLIFSYALLMFLAYAFSGIIAGVVLRRTLLHRLHGVTASSWQDAVLGTFVIHIVFLVPFIGTLSVLLLSAVSVGVLATIAYQTAFISREDALS